MKTRSCRRQRALAPLLACVTALAGCSHTVTVYSVPPGAEIYVDGRSIGRSPATFEERSGFHRTVEIRAELEGHGPWSEQHEQKEPSKLLAPSLVGGYFLLLPFIGVLWGYQLEDQVTIFLEPETAAPAP